MENNQKFLNVNIIGVGTYLPDNKVDNEYYINHFKELKGIDITGALESIGRDYRHISTDEELLTLFLIQIQINMQHLKAQLMDSQDI